jgi:hypothetical protein
VDAFVVQKSGGSPEKSLGKGFAGIIKRVYLIEMGWRWWWWCWGGGGGCLHAQSPCCM